VVQNPTKTQKEKNTNFHLKSPNQNHNKKINNQMGFQMRTQNSQHDQNKEQSQKINPRENINATITEFEKGEACESN